MAFAMSGSGTSSNPYQIASADDLCQISQSPSSYYKLVNDIDLSQWIADNDSELGWSPLCSSSRPFTGTLDGAGYSIINLYINRNSDYNGLISYAGSAKVQNLNIQCDITGEDYTAAVIGYGTGNITFTNCSVEGDIQGDRYVGGFVGGSSAGLDFTNSFVVGNIEGVRYVGGILGRAKSMALTRCAVEGNVTGHGDYTGGLVGYIEKHIGSYSTETHAAQINLCYVKGDILSSKNYVGGLIGFEDGTYANQGHSDTVYGTNYYGVTNSSLINDSYFEGDITATGNYVGGISGYATGKYKRCYVIGTISGANYIGGIAGALCGMSNHGYTVKATVNSCVCLCSSIQSKGSEISRICNISNNIDMGSSGSNTENKALAECMLFQGGSSLSIDDSDSNGYVADVSSLQRASTYTAIGWDFTNIWKIKEGEGYPYIQLRDISSSREEQATFDFTSPLDMDIIPSDDIEGDVEIFGPYEYGTLVLTLTNAVEVTENGPSYYAEIGRNGTLTISGIGADKILKVVFDDASHVDYLTPNSGSMDGNMWVGNSSSVVFTVADQRNATAAINSLIVYYESRTSVLVDGTTYHNKQNKSGQTIIYKRNFNNTNWQSFYVPFSMSYDDWNDQDLEVARINAFYEYDNDEDGKVDETVLEFIKVKRNNGTLLPNHPYIVRAKSEGERTITVNNTTLYTAKSRSIDCSSVDNYYQFTGVYETTSGIKDIGGYVLGGGQLGHPTNNQVAPYRWYLSRESRGSQFQTHLPSKIRLQVRGDDNEITEIDEISNMSEDAPNYMLNGIRANVSSIGLPIIYINNGKKVLIK